MGTSRIPLLLIFFAALAVRFFHLFSIETTPLSSFLIGDEITHWRWAHFLVSGKIAECTPFFRAPLYGFFLAFQVSHAVDPLYATRFFQAIFGAGSVLAVMGIALELCSPAVAWIAGILVATSPILILFEGHLLIVSMYTFLGTGALYLLVRGVGRNGTAAVAGAGVLFGLCVLSRPNMLLFIPPAVFYLFRKRGALSSLIFSALFVLCFVPSGWMNWKYGKEPCLISTQGGINFYAGNGLQADGLIPVEPINPLSPSETNARVSRLPESAWSTDNLWTASLIIASRDLGFPLRQTAVSRWWFLKTFQEVIRNPAAFFRRLFKKLVFLAGGIEVPNNLDPTVLMERFYPLLDVLHSWNRFSFLFVLFLPGCCIAWKKYPGTRIVLLYLFVLGLGLIAFFVNARFRAPLLPVLSLFAAVCLETFWKGILEFVKHPRRRMIPACAALLFPAILLTQCCRLYPETWQVRASRALFLNSLASAFLEGGKTGEAIDLVEKALELDTAEAFLFYRTRARIELKRGKELDRAIRFLERSAELLPHPRTLEDLARLYDKAGRVEEARAVRETLSGIHQEARS